jgi:hypothetical protein
VDSGEKRVRAQDSMSRTKKSGSTAQRSTSLSRRPGSGFEPAARAAWNLTDASLAAKALATRMFCWVSFVVPIGATSCHQ